MAEIKSTLDLVMERTKHLSLSQEEKQGQEAEAAKKQFNGVVQKFLDDLMNLQEVQQAVVKISETYSSLDSHALPEMVLDRIDMEALQGPLPVLLHDVFGYAIEGLKELGDQYADEIQAEAARYSNRLRQVFKQEYQISGTALVPNSEADPQWNQALENIVCTYEKKLAAEKNNILS